MYTYIILYIAHVWPNVKYIQRFFHVYIHIEFDDASHLLYRSKRCTCGTGDTLLCYLAQPMFIYIVLHVWTRVTPKHRDFFLAIRYYSDLFGMFNDPKV